MRNSSGGAAAAGGFNFQHRVAAWVAAHILAEKAASPPWNLPVESTLEWLRCETEQPVDDLLIGTSVDGLIFMQVKHRINLSSRADSDLSSAIDQFVRQFISSRNKTGRSTQTDRPLDPAKDRLVLVTSSISSEPVRVHIPRVLRKIRSLTQGQTIDETATNNDERQALSTIREHICRAWKALMDAEPSQGELKELLSLMYIQVLDVDSEGEGEREAKNLLRSEVLRDPDQADQAWSHLVALCANYAANGSGADRAIFQRELLDAGFDIKIPRSFEADINRLRSQSRQTSKALDHLAQIQIGSTTIKIDRACTQALKQAAEQQSLVVVGEPGAGKSGSLHELVEALDSAGRDYVFFAVDHLASRSLGELRQELGLEHELLEVLRSWPGQQPAFLVIDALDAARADTAGNMIRELIRRVIEESRRWRVVVSIRKYDLRYGVEIQQLFSGDPPTGFRDPEFQHVRHLNIPQLSDEELEQIGSKSPQIKLLIEKAPEKFLELLRVAFNLRLLAELLNTGINVDELTSIRTQGELLDWYWQYRVIRSDDLGDAREVVLRQVCEAMVEKRTLRVHRSVVARPDTSTVLNDLLSTHVLIEWQPSSEAQPDRYILAFSHNVLFDYAVARLLFRGDAAGIIRYLTGNPDLVIVIRPSIVFHFSHLWNIDKSRRAFWDLVFRIIQADNIPEIGKLIGPAVAAELTKTMDDLEPLCTALEASDQGKQEAAEEAFRYLAGALRALLKEENLIGPGAGPWFQLVDRVIERSLRRPVAYTIRYLLTVLCDYPERFTQNQKEAAGRTARRLLEFAWSQEPRDPWLVIHALQCVCRTFDSDRNESTSLIRRAIAPLHLKQFGFKELPWLAQEVKRLIPFDPGLVADIYCSAFSHQEESEEPTPMGTSQILSLISNRRQDYESALYVLAEAFPEFLRTAPQEATRSLVAVMQAYVEQRHAPAYDDVQDEKFDFYGRVAYIRTDYSHIWDEGDAYRHEEPLKMLDAFQNFLEELAKKEKKEELRALIEIIVLENRTAVIWRRLLIVGSRYPEMLGKEILPLAWALPVLTSSDTTSKAGEYLKAIFPVLKPDQRQRIEQAILSIPETMPRDPRKLAVMRRDHLLGCLQLEAIVTEEARQRLEELQDQNAVPCNEPIFRIEPVEWQPDGEEEFLKDQGVPVDTESNRRIRELGRSVKKFSDKHFNSSPSIEEAKAILSALRVLHNALTHADADGVHPKQKDYAWGILAAASACIVRAESFSCNDDLGTFVKGVLLEASCYPKPVHDPQYDTQFDERPGWSPAARIDAAEGLVTIAQHLNCTTPDVLEAVERLSNDSVPAVRYQIVSGLDFLYRPAPELMWRIIERMSKQEQSRGVLQGLLSGTLSRLAGIESERVATFTKIIFNRIHEGAGAEEVRKFCVGIFSKLYIWKDHNQSK